MVRRVVLLGFLCACTQDFGVFDPADASIPEAQADVSTPDVSGDVTPLQDVTVLDSPPDVVDAAPDVVTCMETGSLTFGGHCYFPIATNQGFNTAKTSCTNASAHLVTITTAAEQAAVISVGTGERWIGLFRNGGAVKDQTYNWITGEGRNGFSAWSPGEPNGSGQCTRVLSTGLWADQDCAIALAAICERE